MRKYYSECPLCGAALDPGEKCDCEKEEEIKENEKIKSRRTPRKARPCHFI